MAYEYKVIPMMGPTMYKEWESEVNDAAGEGFELVATPATSEIVYAVMQRKAAAKTAPATVKSAARVPMPAPATSGLRRRSF